MAQCTVYRVFYKLIFRCSQDFVFRWFALCGLQKASERRVILCLSYQKLRVTFQLDDVLLFMQFYNQTYQELLGNFLAAFGTLSNFSFRATSSNFTLCK